MDPGLLVLGLLCLCGVFSSAARGSFFWGGIGVSFAAAVAVVYSSQPALYPPPHALYDCKEVLSPGDSVTRSRMSVHGYSTEVLLLLLPYHVLLSTAVSQPWLLRTKGWDKFGLM